MVKKRVAVGILGAVLFGAITTIIMHIVREFNLLFIGVACLLGFNIFVKIHIKLSGNKESSNETTS
ncbi:MAG: hypothetical protein FWE19_01775 [Oscillospiraceae bacterium]|nr:hypothetical protein [Oscillospiraceae bacterium]